MDRETHPTPSCTLQTPTNAPNSPAHLKPAHTPQPPCISQPPCPEAAHATMSSVCPLSQIPHRPPLLPFPPVPTPLPVCFCRSGGSPRPVPGISDVLLLISSLHLFLLFIIDGITFPSLARRGRFCVKINCLSSTGGLFGFSVLSSPTHSPRETRSRILQNRHGMGQK